jgi:hypothetical protein
MYRDSSTNSISSPDTRRDCVPCRLFACGNCLLNALAESMQGEKRNVNKSAKQANVIYAVWRDIKVSYENKTDRFCSRQSRKGDE